MARPCLPLRHCSRSHGFNRGQRTMRITIAATTTAGIRTGCDAKKPPVSSAGELLRDDAREEYRDANQHHHAHRREEERLGGRGCGDARDRRSGMLVRKMPIMATVPACAGATALIAVPPCDAAHAVLNERPLRGYATRRMAHPVRHGRLGRLQRKSEREPVNGNVPDPLEDADAPVPQVTENVAADDHRVGTGARRVPRRPP